MATKTVEFWRIDLCDNQGNYLDYKQLKGFLDKVFKDHCIENGEYRSLDLSPEIKPEDIEPKKILDLFEDNLYLFGRISKRKNRNSLMRRTYSNLQADEVFNSSEALNQGIEVFTFFILDYTKGILAIANTKDAPGVGVLNNIFECYCPQYKMEFTEIPNGEGVNALYGAAHPEITRLEFEISRPNIEYLMKVLSLDEDVVLEMLKNNNFRAGIVIKSQPYKKLETDQGTIRKIIDILKNKKEKYSKTIIAGKSDEFNLREFDLHAKYFTYPINVRNFKYDRGKKIEYTLEEITTQFRDGLHEAYNGNYKMVIALADRMD